MKQIFFQLTLFTKRNNISTVCLYYKLQFWVTCKSEKCNIASYKIKQNVQKTFHPFAFVLFFCYSFLFFFTHYDTCSERKTRFNYKIFKMGIYTSFLKIVELLKNNKLIGK